MLIHRQAIAVCATAMLLLAFGKNAFPFPHASTIRVFLANAD